MKNWRAPEHWQKITTIDAHTAGEPFRVITSGFPSPEGETILAKRRFVKEKYDHLPADQRESRLEQEQQQQKALEIEQLRQMELELQQAAEREEAERKRQEELARQKPTETPVTILGNRVFVPVTIGNNGIEIQVRLLLDML